MNYRRDDPRRPAGKRVVKDFLGRPVPPPQPPPAPETVHFRGCEEVGEEGQCCERS